MNFFKSVFSDDPDSESTSDPQPEPPNPNSNLTTIATAWTFGSSLMKTLASKSESVIETYKRDLEEFSSGLKKETAVIRQAVLDLPNSLEAGAAVAQESLESVGQVIDNLGNTVTQVIAHGKDSILNVNDSDGDDISDANHSTSQLYSKESKPYSRLDAQIRMVQCDMNSYLEDVEDLGEYNEWKLGFLLDEKMEEIEDLISGNGVVGEIYKEIVPARVEESLFWTRYFYRVSKVKKAEEARAKLVKRAIEGEEEEELTWDVDEDDYEESGVSNLKGGDSEGEVYDKDSTEKDVGKSAEIEVKRLEKENDEVGVLQEKDMGNLQVETESKPLETGNDEEVSVSEAKDDNLESNSDEKTTSEGKTDKDSDFSVVSSQPSPEEEYGWDEIEDDIGTSEEIQVASHDSPSRADLRKRLSVAEEEVDLTWDIEDDDEPVRS